MEGFTVSKNRMLRGGAGRERKGQEPGENCIMRNLMICTLREA
jgi:hypothetical protein